MKQPLTPRQDAWQTTNQESIADDIALPGMSTREVEIRRRVHRLAEFYRHAMIYLVFMTIVWISNFVIIHNADPTYLPGLLAGERKVSWRYLWGIWPSLGWGIGVVCHGITVLPFWNFLTQDWEDRKVREIMEREGK